ncbi:MAG: Fic family protein [Rhabdochlamydiaceae bacterium]|jgi:hypothetical protein
MSINSINNNLQISGGLSHEIDPRPSKEQMQKVFWGLGERFWMQIIDGKYHEFGCMVFDQGLHGGAIEPGFFESMKQGCQFASDHLSQPLTIDFYKELHRKLCAHFKGDETETLMNASEAGCFRKEEGSFRMSEKKLFPQVPFTEDELRIPRHVVSMHYQIEAMNNLEKRFPNSDPETVEEMRQGQREQLFKYYRAVFPEEGSQEDDFDRYKFDQNCKKIIELYPKCQQMIQDCKDYKDEKLAKFNKVLSDAFSCFSFSQPVHAEIDPNGTEHVMLIYNLNEPEKLELVVQTILENYNNEVNKINQIIQKTSNKEEIKQLMKDKLKAIADLYQMLEWLHPFCDGQGRTDLVVLSKTLTEQGFNPPILIDPYISSSNTLQRWGDELLKGTELWRTEQAKT